MSTQSGLGHFAFLGGSSWSHVILSHISHFVLPSWFCQSLHMLKSSSLECAKLQQLFFQSSSESLSVISGSEMVCEVSRLVLEGPPGNLSSGWTYLIPSPDSEELLPLPLPDSASSLPDSLLSLLEPSGCESSSSDSPSLPEASLAEPSSAEPSSSFSDWLPALSPTSESLLEPEPMCDTLVVKCD